MEWWVLTLIFALGILIALISGIPVFAAFLVIDLVGMVVFMGGTGALSSLMTSFLTSVAKFALTPVPLFVVMGQAIFVSGVASRALDVIERMLARLPGRLSLVAVAAGALFATLSGSCLGTCAMLGALLVPDMTNRHYHKAMIMGPIMSGAVLSVIIPPSVLAIILGALGGIPVGKLLIGGFIPGLLLAGLYIVYIIFRCSRNPSLAPLGVAPTAAQRGLALAFVRDVLPLGVIVLAVFGGIFAGIATPTEAAALGAAASLILAAVNRGLDLPKLKAILVGALEVSVMVFTIMMGSVAFSQLLGFTGVIKGLVGFTVALPVAPVIILAMMVAVLIVMGTLIDPISMIMIGAPIFLPIAAAMGYDIIWFGILFLVAISLGEITPPFGVLLFIMKGVAPKEVTMGDIYRSAIPYSLLTILGIGVIMVFPILATWLPSIMLR